MKRTLCILLAAGLGVSSGAALAQDKAAPAGSTVNAAAAAASSAPAGSTVNAAAAAVSSPPAGAPAVFDRIAIRVGSEIVTSLEIEEPLRQLRERLAQQFRGEELEKKMQQARQEHLKRLVEDKLLLLEAKSQGLEVTEAQVDDRVKQQMEALRAQFPSEQDFEKQLATEHLTVENLRERQAVLIKEQFLRQRLLQTKLQEFSTGAEVSDAQLSKYFDQHRDEFRRPPRVYLNQIFVARPDSGLPAAAFEKQDNQARAKIDQALAELKNGREFGAAARKFSEHRVTAEKGGEVGWISQGETGMPDFEREVFEKLKVGQTSPVIATGRGYFIVHIKDRQDGGMTPFEEVKGRIRQTLMAQGSDVRYQAWIETLKGKFPVSYSK